MGIYIKDMAQIPPREFTPYLFSFFIETILIISLL